MKKSVKRWSVNALCKGMGQVAYFSDGRSIGRVGQTNWEDLCPVQHLLVAMAGCFALSCRAIFLRKRLKGVELEVVVVAQGAAGAASRVSHIMVSAIFRGNVTDAVAAGILEDAKPLCTVANTVRGGPTISYQSRTMASRPATHPVQNTGIRIPRRGGWVASVDQRATS